MQLKFKRKFKPKLKRYFQLTLTIICLFFIVDKTFASSLRIVHLARCGDLLDQVQQEFCLTIKAGADKNNMIIKLNKKTISAKNIKRKGDLWRVNVSSNDYTSGPLWVEQGNDASNPVWLSLKGSHVVAAHKNEMAKNMDGISTYVNLISLIIEEQYDGLTEAAQLAEKYGAKVVGSIPPLNLYQLRLPSNNLIERDALVLRFGSEISVDAVVIEETGPENEFEGDSITAKSINAEEWSANRFLDAVDYYRRRIPAKSQPVQTHPVRVGIVERNIDFDSPDFTKYIGDCRSGESRICLYARDAEKPDSHGTTVAGILAAEWDNGGNTGFLRGLADAGPAFDVIVDRNSDAGITANIAASVNMVEDGVRVINWSWGIHRVGAKNIAGDEIDSLVRSGVAMNGYEELLEEFFLWLRLKHPDVVVVNSAGNGASFSGLDEYRLPSSFITENLFVVGGHERSEKKEAAVDDPEYVIKRGSSNIDMRVDITAAACVRGSTLKMGEKGEVHCGTSYATPLVTGLLAAMLSINPALEPEQLRILLRRSALTIGEESDFEAADADDLTAPILPSERNNKLNHRDVGHSARLNMHKALDLAVQSVDRVR